jgi:hypothetical protein
VFIHLGRDDDDVEFSTLEERFGLFQAGRLASIACPLQNGAPEFEQIWFISDTKNLWPLFCH